MGLILSSLSLLGYHHRNIGAKEDASNHSHDRNRIDVHAFAVADAFALSGACASLLAGAGFGGGFLCGFCRSFLFCLCHVCSFYYSYAYFITLFTKCKENLV